MLEARTVKDFILQTTPPASTGIPINSYAGDQFYPWYSVVDGEDKGSFAKFCHLAAWSADFIQRYFTRADTHEHLPVRFISSTANNRWPVIAHMDRNHEMVVALNANFFVLPEPNEDRISMWQLFLDEHKGGAKHRPISEKTIALRMIDEMLDALAVNDAQRASLKNIAEREYDVLRNHCASSFEEFFAQTSVKEMAALKRWAGFLSNYDHLDYVQLSKYFDVVGKAVEKGLKVLGKGDAEISIRTEDFYPDSHARKNSPAVVEIDDNSGKFEITIFLHAALEISRRPEFVRNVGGFRDGMLTKLSCNLVRQLYMQKSITPEDADKAERVLVGAGRDYR